MKYKANFEVKPPIELGEYRGLEIESPKIEVSETDVDAMIERLRDQASHYRVETERGLEEGDFGVIEIVSGGEGIEAEERLRVISGSVKRRPCRRFTRPCAERSRETRLRSTRSTARMPARRPGAGRPFITT